MRGWKVLFITLCSPLWLSHALEVPEPPPLPAPGVEFKLGEESLIILPPDRLPQIEALYPKVSPEENAVRYYFAAINRWSKDQKMESTLVPWKPEWATSQPKLKEYLEKNTAAFALLDRAAKLPTARWPILMQPGAKGETYFSARMPHLSTMRSFARGRTFLFYVAMEQRKYDETIRQIEATFALSTHLEMCGGLIDALVSVAIDGIAMANVQELICVPDLTGEQLKRLKSVVENRQKTLGRGSLQFKVEELSSLQMLDKFLAGDFSTLRGEDGPTDPNLEILSTRMARVIIPDRTARAHFTGLYKDIQARIAEPYWKNTKWDGEFERKIMELPSWNYLAKMLMPVLSRANSSIAYRRVQFDLASAALLIRLSELESKTPVHSLDAFTAKLPVDEFTNKPLLFADTKGRRIYSVGPNLKDDGGNKSDQLDVVFYLEESPDRRSKPLR